MANEFKNYGRNCEISVINVKPRMKIILWKNSVKESIGAFPLNSVQNRVVKKLRFTLLATFWTFTSNFDDKHEVVTDKETLQHTGKKVRHIYNKYEFFTAHFDVPPQ